MTWYVWRGAGVTPANVILDNVRNRIDTSGPHLITLGLRTTTADFGVGSCAAYFQYETPNGEIQTLGTGYVSLTQISDAGGGIWYEPLRISIDENHPLADGPIAADPRGFYTLGLTLSGSAGAAKITYEAMLMTFDGNSAVVNIP